MTDKAGNQGVAEIGRSGFRLVDPWPIVVLVGAVCLLAIGAIFLGTFREMVETWWASKTFNHAFLIFPIAGYLIWLRREELRQVAPTPFFWGLLPLAAGALLWLVGSAAFVLVIQEFAVIVMIQALAVTILGLRVSRLLAFPLFYLFFAVPAGEFLVPPLQDFTAVFIVSFLRVMSIPVFHDGIFITIPTGSFEVAEACAGLRFLIATMALGFLFAHLTYRSWKRRVVFILLCLVVPVIANGLRALGIVLLAYYTDNKIAVGVDHIVYGWGFFAFITIVLLLVGMKFSDRGDGDDESASETRLATGTGAPPAPVWKTVVAGVVAVAAAAAAPTYSTAVTAYDDDGRTYKIAVPDVTGSWRPEADAVVDWRPRFNGVDAEHLSRLNNGSESLIYYVGYYVRQRQDGELVNSSNTLAGQESWQRAGGGTTNINVEGTELRAPYVRFISRDGARVAVYWYWVDDRFVATPHLAKLLQARAMLFGGQKAAAVVAVVADYEISAKEGLRRIRNFLGQTSGIRASLEAAGEQ